LLILRLTNRLPSTSPAPVSSPHVAVAAPAAAAAEVDLLSLVQLPRDVVKGTWTREGAVLLAKGAFGNTQVPLAPGTDEYDVVLTARQPRVPGGRDSDSGFQIGLVAQGRQFHIRVNRNSCGISYDANTAKPPYTAEDLNLNFDEPFTAVFAVRKASVRF